MLSKTMDFFILERESHCQMGVIAMKSIQLQAENIISKERALWGLRQWLLRVGSLSPSNRQSSTD
jgi:hypothetical protein